MDIRVVVGKADDHKDADLQLEMNTVVFGPCGTFREHRRGETAPALALGSAIREEQHRDYDAVAWAGRRSIPHVNEAQRALVPAHSHKSPRKFLPQPFMYADAHAADALFARPRPSAMGHSVRARAREIRAAWLGMDDTIFCATMPASKHVKPTRPSPFTRVLHDLGRRGRRIAFPNGRVQRLRRESGCSPASGVCASHVVRLSQHYASPAEAGHTTQVRSASRCIYCAASASADRRKS